MLVDPVIHGTTLAACEFMSKRIRRGAAMTMQDKQAREIEAGERPTLKPTNQARQGVTGHNVRYVLLIGLVGVVVAFLIIYLMYFG
jgi:hypothetical protein